MSDRANIGVFVCRCGDRIASALSVPGLVQHARNLPAVIWAGYAGYWCLPGGIEHMRAIIAERHLDRIVIAGCTPRTHDALFRCALDGVSNPALISVTNLRDLCVRPHRGDPLAESKARAQITMAVAEIAARQPGVPRVARVEPYALVIGGGIAGMTAALAISDAGIPVMLIERDSELGGLARVQPGDHETATLITERIAAVRTRGNIRVTMNVVPTSVSGTVGQYQVALSNGERVRAGVIVVATGGRCESQILNPKSGNHAFVLCDMIPEKTKTCLHSCCLNAIRQATALKARSADSKVTVFFRELYTAGGTYDDLVWEAQRLGVRFVRYPSGRVPQPANGEIVTYDELTNRDVRVSYDQVVPAASIAPQKDAAQLAEMFRLPMDSNGFIADTRIRLRPADRIERGIYVCGAAHFPCDADRAILQAYGVAARAIRHIRRGEIVNGAPAAAVDTTRCNGCGDCVRVCPFAAVTLAQRQAVEGMRRLGDSESRLAVIDTLLCTGCGNCVSVCPVKAAQVPTPSDEQIEAQIRAALNGQGNKDAGGQGGKPRVLLFACEWSGYSAAEIAGARGLAYPACTRVIRVNCSGRLQPGLLLKTLEMGAAGVMVLGCAPGICHHEQGNERAAAVFEQASALGNLMGLDKRLALKWIPPDDGTEFVRVVNDFVERLATEGG